MRLYSFTVRHLEQEIKSYLHIVNTMNLKGSICTKLLVVMLTTAPTASPYFLRNVIFEVANSVSDASVKHDHLSWPNLQPEQVSIQ